MLNHVANIFLEQNKYIFYISNNSLLFGFETFLIYFN